MKRWPGLFAVLALLGVVSLGIASRFIPSELERRHATIQPGMSMMEVAGFMEPGKEPPSLSSGQGTRWRYRAPERFLARAPERSVMFNESGRVVQTSVDDQPRFTQVFYVGNSASFEVADDAENDSLARFPTLDACNARIRVLLEQRHQLRLAEPSPKQQRAFQRNTHALKCWEALHEARGGLAEEEGGRDDAETRGRALSRLREILSEQEWRAGQMP